MPIYEYKCKKCGNVFEHLARTSSDSAKKCSKCGADNIVKQFSTFSTSDSSSSSYCPTGTCPTSSCPTGTCSL